MERNENFTNTLQQKDRENVWHHISMYNEKAPPMIVEHGDGAWITDSGGNRFFRWYVRLMGCQCWLRARATCTSSI